MRHKANDGVDLYAIWARFKYNTALPGVVWACTAYSLIHSNSAVFSTEHRPLLRKAVQVTFTRPSEHNEVAAAAAADDVRCLCGLRPASRLGPVRSHLSHALAARASRLSDRRQPVSDARRLDQGRPNSRRHISRWHWRPCESVLEAWIPGLPPCYCRWLRSVYLYAVLTPRQRTTVCADTPSRQR